MARPQVFTSDTTLYHPVEGPRVFPAGETDPGAAWSDNPGGDRSETSMPNVMKDLISANDRADALGVKLDKQAYDMAQTAAEAPAAKEALGAMEQRAIAAEGAKADAEEAAKAYMAERDSARAEATAAKEALASSDAAAKARIDDLVAQLAAANQALADAQTPAAPEKAPKAKKTDAAPAPDAAEPPAAT